MDYRLPDSSVHMDSPGKNTRMGCHTLQEMNSVPLPARGSSPGPHTLEIPVFGFPITVPSPQVECPSG